MAKITKEIKKDLKRNLNETEPSDTLYNKVSENVNVNPVYKTKSYKRLIPVFLVICLLLVGTISAIFLTKERGTITNKSAIVQIDTNPSIQMVVNEKNEVVSVNGLNDEGKMVLADEEIVGKTYEEALDTIIKVETELGYLTVSTNDNQITITVSADSDEIVKQLETKSEKVVNNLKDTININIEKAKGYALEELRAFVKKIDETYTDEEIAQMDYQTLINVVKVYQLEVADLASVELEKLYQDFKNHRFLLVEKIATKEALNKLDNIYSALIVSYNTAYDVLNNAYTAMQDKYYEIFVDPSSDYQQAYLKLAESKETYLENRQKYANALKNPELSELELALIEAEYNKAKLSYEAQKEILEATEKASLTVYNALEKVFSVALKTLDDLEKTFPEKISDSYTEILTYTENKLNEFKEKACSEFEEKYQDDINQLKEDLKARKEALKEKIANAKK